MNTENTAIVQRVFDCWNKRDFSVITELFPDSIYHSSVTGELKGEAYRRYFTALLDAFPDGRLTVNDQIGEGEKVAVRWKFTGTHKGELMGLAPTGKQVSMTGISIIRIANGKIAEAWEEWDNLGMMQQLGLVPTVKFEAKVAA
jgi:steroid delta-isomerase-like uncharacterized protein